MGALDLPDEGSDETGADDGLDDGLDGLGFVPDPAERTWRHPSEIAAANAHAARYANDAATSQPTASFATGGWGLERAGQPSYRLVGTLVAGALLAGFVVLQFQGPRPSDRALPETAQLNSDPPVGQVTVRVSTTSEQRSGDDVSDASPVGVTTSRLPAVRSDRGAAANNWAAGPQENVAESADRSSPNVTVPGVYGVRVSVPLRSERVSTAFREWGTTIGIRSPRLLTAAFSLDRAEAARPATKEEPLLCSGVAVGDFVLTSSSALGDHETVLVDVGSRTVVLTVAGRDPSSDLAVLIPRVVDTTSQEGSAEDLAPESVTATLAVDSVVLHPDPGSVEIGDWVGVVAGVPHNAHTGTVLATSEHSSTTDGQDIVGVMSTSAVLPGNAAGGAIVDDRGRVIGVIVNDDRYLASGIRIDHAIEFAEAVIDGNDESGNTADGAVDTAAPVAPSASNE